jgi:putative endonuclease
LSTPLKLVLFTKTKKMTHSLLGSRSTMTPYYVYILLCENNSYYTGYTKSVKSRLRQHQNGKGARYTKMHKPQSLVYVEQLCSRSEAMKREKKIKKLSHKQKLKLANSYAKNQKKQPKSKGKHQVSRQT